VKRLPPQRRARWFVQKVRLRPGAAQERIGKRKAYESDVAEGRTIRSLKGIMDALPCGYFLFFRALAGNFVGRFFYRMNREGNIADCQENEEESADRAGGNKGHSNHGKENCRAESHCRQA